MKTLIVGELAGAAPSGTTAQLISAASALGDTGAYAVFMSGPGTDMASLSRLPVQAVHMVEHGALADDGPGGFEAALDALAAVCVETGPDVVLFARTDFGASVGTRLGARLGAPVAQDCTAVFPGEAGGVRVTRPVYGGAALATFDMTGPGPAVVIVRPGSFAQAALDGGSPAVVLSGAGAHIRTPRVRLLESVPESQPGMRLEDAKVVVSGGRGLGGAAPFAHLEELAGLLGGAVGASRAACDAGWIDHSHQVGLTGKTVSPELYFAVAISGASQHMAGCSGSGAIVAINRDSEANIFKEARFGVAGDWQKVLPAFIATVRELSLA